MTTEATPASSPAVVASGRVARLSYFFPAHDEEANLAGLVEEALDVLPTLADEFEIIAVNDGSRDRTREIADDLQQALKPRGVAVRVEARHLCMAMRGVEQKNADVVTMFATGVMKSDPALAEEFRAALAAPRR